MLYIRLQVIAIFLCCSAVVSAQSGSPTVIKLDNAGFDGSPKASAEYISGWKDCGRSRFPRESAVDLQPGFFDVVLEPKEGRSYLGMVARDNESWESVTQLLRKPLQPEQCYTMSLHLAASPTYRSNARGEGIAVEEAKALGINLEYIHHITPIVLRIWGTVDQCSPAELLAETAEITNNNWKKFDFRFEPKAEMNFIMLEAFYKTPSPFPDNGHILIDDLSDIVAVPCSMDPPIVSFVSPKKSIETEKTAYKIKANLKNVYNKENIELMLNNKRYSDFDFDTATGNLTAEIPLRKGANKIEIKGSNTEGDGQAITSISQKKEAKVIAAVPKPKPQNSATVEVEEPIENTLEGVKREDLKKDLKLEIKDLAFEVNSAAVQDKHEKSLLKIVNFLNSNNDVVVEIGGHTNNRCEDLYCDQLSEDRAKSVANFLVQNGVNEQQLRSKGYGRTQPVASNNSAYGRKRNQRVEIKILNIDG